MAAPLEFINPAYRPFDQSNSSNESKKGTILEILEKNFAPSDTTDLVFVCEGKKLHVNKQFLCFHSNFFRIFLVPGLAYVGDCALPVTAFSYACFGSFLSLFYPNAVLPSREYVDQHLQLAKSLQMPAATKLLEQFLILSRDSLQTEKLRLADKYDLSALMDSVLEDLNSEDEVKSVLKRLRNVELKDSTKVKLFNLLFVPAPHFKNIDAQIPPMAPTVLQNLLIRNFAYSAGHTDAILLVGDDCLHVNKAFLSFHSGFFAGLFGGNFMENYTSNFRINEVSSVDLGSLLSFLYPNSVLPNAQNIEKLLELADRFLMPGVLKHLEQFLVLSKDVTALYKLIYANQYNLPCLMSKTLKSMKTKGETAFTIVIIASRAGGIQDQMMRLIVDHLNSRIVKDNFAPSEKTNTVLLVGNKKMHVNKEMLSFQSDFFKRLFDGDHKEMVEVPIEGVTFLELRTFFRSYRY
ncbi:unnamed protein product [Caenorhabditis sp. 36 PRJEB53466]|nr:unnamed protein product [Caenorhabditis sp. 36 PRJEB53466]